MNVTLGQAIEVILTNYQRRIAICTEILQDGQVIRCAVFTRQTDPLPDSGKYPVWEWTNVPYAVDTDNIIGTWHFIATPVE